MEQYNQSKKIFLTGCPRSGTTLLQSIIATHDLVKSLFETHFFTVVTDNIDSSNPNKIISKREYLIMISRLSKNLFDTNNLSFEPSTTFKQFFEAILGVYIDKNSMNGNQYILEKTPQHIYRVDEISSYYKKAIFIYIKAS